MKNKNPDDSTDSEDERAAKESIVEKDGDIRLECKVLAVQSPSLIYLSVAKMTSKYKE